MEKIALKNKITSIHPRYWLLVGGVVFLIGTGVTIFTARQTETRERELLLTRAETIAAGVHSESLLSLSGTISDLYTLAYQDLKKQLINVRAVNPETKQGRPLT